MGVTGLHKFVENSCRPANIKDFAGATVAIDAYSWLHKGAFSCAEKLVKGEKTDGYVYYCIKLLNMLLDAGVKPLMVFDGCNLPSKAVTEKKRRENREKTRQRGKELLCEGKIKEARECFQRCVDVTPEMAREVIQACRKKSIDCIVAPYEADAQMAYLDLIGVTQLTITEDSDLILFGCTKILFKMDSCGVGFLYEKENLNKSFGVNASKYDFEKFRYMCILSGCDYLPSLPGIGLKKACTFFTKTCITDLAMLLPKIPSYLKMPKLSVSNEYKDSFIKANNTFLHQLVFCPKKKCLVPLHPYPEGINPEDMEYAGKYLNDDLAFKLAMGDINVKTLQEYDSDDFQSSSRFDESKSRMWSSSIDSMPKKKPKNETAFKFSTPKRKLEDVSKVNLAKVESKNMNDLPSTDELFSMYGGSTKRSKLDEFDEEPIPESYESKTVMQSPVETGRLKNTPSFNKRGVVKSRFFSSESVPSSQGSSGYFSSPSSTNNSVTEIFSNSEISDSLVQAPSPILEKDEVEDTILSTTPKQSNKENRLNRFAKKKPDASPVLNDDEVHVASPKKDSLSVLDVFSTESTAATSTVSSMQKCSKILSQAVAEGTVVKIKPNNLFSKKNKLITTEIKDYKWTKEEKFSKAPIGENSVIDEELCDGELEKIIDLEPEKVTDLEPEEKSPLKEISPYFFNVSDDPCDNAQDDSVITILSDCEDSEQCDVEKKSNSPKSSEKRNLKTSNSSSKVSKCRTIGLSKKRKSTGATSRKETLLNFNFTRLSVPLKPN